MGCSASAYSDACNEHDWALSKLGLNGDKKYGRFDAYSWQGRMIVRCARDGSTKEDTILAIITESKMQEARNEFQEEMEERKLLQSLKDKY